MKVYDLKDTEGRVFAFEVDNLFLGRRSACRVVRAIAGARIVREQRPLSWRHDEFCEFEVEGITFVISEDWGDSSRYWIGPIPPRAVPEIDQVRAAFLRKSTAVRATVLVSILVLAVLRIAFPH